MRGRMRVREPETLQEKPTIRDGRAGLAADSMAHSCKQMRKDRGIDSIERASSIGEENYTVVESRQNDVVADHQGHGGIRAPFERNFIDDVTGLSVRNN